MALHPLDNPKTFALDRGNVIASIDMLADQAKQAWSEAKRIHIPESFRDIDHIVMNGMGGSGLAGHIVEAAFRDKLTIPFFLTHSYKIPKHVGKKTLYIISSYSGDTEEVLASYEEAKRRGAHVLGIASGGVLGEKIKKGALTGYCFKPVYNPGKKPRFALGYSIFGVLGLLDA
ncbi:MAG: SIS domain-containing protein, partial [bacterium]|nr:SIS domain-containing protein [bacterium]